MGRGVADISQYKLKPDELAWNSRKGDFPGYSGKHKYTDFVLGMNEVLQEASWAVDSGKDILIPTNHADPDQSQAIIEMLKGRYRFPSNLRHPVVSIDGSSLVSVREAEATARRAKGGVLFIDGIDFLEPNQSKVIQRGAVAGDYVIIGLNYAAVNTLTSSDFIISGGVQQNVPVDQDARDRFARWADTHVAESFPDMRVDRAGLAYLFDHFRASGAIKNRIVSGICDYAGGLLMKAAAITHGEGRKLLTTADLKKARETEIATTVSEQWSAMELPEACRTSGLVVGSSNGLAFVSTIVLGGYGVAIPLSASVALGEGGFTLSNEDNTMLAGTSEGNENNYFGQAANEVVTYLMHRYPRIFERVGINISPVAEHNIGDGPSMSALLAALAETTLAEVPINQRYAVTGEFDPRGNVLKIGGEKQKVEGWARSSVEKGDAVAHAAILPEWNARNLMLGEDVLQQVADGRYEVFRAPTVAAIEEILTDGVPAGEIYRRASARLSRRSFGMPGRSGKAASRAR